MDRGKWIAIEGIDGVGKTTLLNTLADGPDSLLTHLNLLNFSHPETLERGPIYTMADEILISVPDVLPKTIQHTMSRMRWVPDVPKFLAAGHNLVTDRCWLSNKAYSTVEDWEVVAKVEEFLPHPDEYIILFREGRRPKEDDPSQVMLSQAEQSYRMMAVHHNAIILNLAEDIDVAAKQLREVISALVEK